MNNFMYHNPTRLIFGKGQLSQLHSLLPAYGSNILLVYGGGSIKSNGIYAQVIDIVGQLGMNVHELGQVEPNPRLTTVDAGINICRREKINFILAVGGGSVLDCAKAISIGVNYTGDVWDIITGQAEGTEAIPFGTVLTLAATGSEMNTNSVITNWERQEKVGWSSPLVFPQFSILDPEFTFSVPRNQTIYGMVDIMSHVFEQYFHHGDNTPIQDQHCESILRTVIHTAPKLLDNLQSYEHRETILYCGTLALNGSLSMGIRGDWASHNIEHAVSAVYDIPHGGGLAILFPNWMEYVLDSGIARFKQFAVQVFGIDPTGQSDRDTALAGIRALRAFFDSIEAPSRLAEYEIGDDKLGLMADKAAVHGPFGNFKKLDREDVLAIYKMSL
jgi:alcohol dehydrogenase YqhD (iron-dependent ADH family)